MPNLAKTLKEEIRRLARKEARASIAQLQKERRALKKTVSLLRKRVQKMERDARIMAARLERKVPGVPAVDSEKAAGVRVTSRNMRALRRKLGLTQVEFARLLNVSGQAVYQWERRTGVLRLRTTTRAALARVREMGRREARALLADMGVVKGVRGRPKKSAGKPTAGRKSPRKKAAKKAGRKRTSAGGRRKK